MNSLKGGNLKYRQWNRSSKKVQGLSVRPQRRCNLTSTIWKSSWRKITYLANPSTSTIQTKLEYKQSLSKGMLLQEYNILSLNQSPRQSYQRQLSLIVWMLWEMQFRRTPYLKVRGGTQISWKAHVLAHKEPSRRLAVRIQRSSNITLSIISCRLHDLQRTVDRQVCYSMTAMDRTKPRKP